MYIYIYIYIYKYIYIYIYIYILFSFVPVEKSSPNIKRMFARKKSGMPNRKKIF